MLALSSSYPPTSLLETHMLACMYALPDSDQDQDPSPPHISQPRLSYSPCPPVAHVSHRTAGTPNPISAMEYIPPLSPIATPYPRSHYSNERDSTEQTCRVYIPFHLLCMQLEATAEIGTGGVEKGQAPVRSPTRNFLMGVNHTPVAHDVHEARNQRTNGALNPHAPSLSSSTGGRNGLALT